MVLKKGEVAVGLHYKYAPYIVFIIIIIIIIISSSSSGTIFLHILDFEWEHLLLCSFSSGINKVFLILIHIFY